MSDSYALRDKRDELGRLYYKVYMYYTTYGVVSYYLKVDLSSLQFSHSVVSDSLRPHELQHTRLPCPLPTPGVYPNPCPLSQ